MPQIEETAGKTRRSAKALGSDTKGSKKDILRRLQKTSIIVGVILSIPFTTYGGIGAGAGWLAGIVWALINIRFIATIVESVLTDGERNHKKIVLAMAVKFPVLYAIGYLLLRSEFFPAIWLLAGFTWPFFVLFMKGAGRAYLKLDQTTSDK